MPDFDFRQPYTPPRLTPYLPPPAPPPRARGWRPTGLVLAGLVALGTLAVTLLTLLTAVAVRDTRGHVGVPDAQRACRTAFEREYQHRADTAVAGAATDDMTIIPSLQGIDLQETWKSGGVVNVNGQIRYSLATAYVDQVSSTINLTCEARRDGHGGITTTVTNRR